MDWRRSGEIDSDLEREIMEATYAALQKHGYADLTVRKIGEEFNQSRSLLYYHYDSKENLVAAFMEYLFERYTSELDLDSDLDTLIKLDRFVNHALVLDRDVSADEFDYWEAFRLQYELRLQTIRNPETREFIGSNYSNIVNRVSEIITEGIAQGRFRNVDPGLTAHLIMGAVDSARGRKIVLGDDEAPQQMRQAFDQVLLPALEPQ